MKLRESGRYWRFVSVPADVSLLIVLSRHSARLKSSHRRHTIIRRPLWGTLFCCYTTEADEKFQQRYHLLDHTFVKELVVLNENR